LTEQVGRVLGALRAARLEHATITVAMGDHGWKLGHLGGWGKHS
jgi:arylsulfatase A-like enzyme